LIIIHSLHYTCIIYKDLLWHVQKGIQFWWIKYWRPAWQSCNSNLEIGKRFSICQIIMQNENIMQNNSEYITQLFALCPNFVWRMCSRYRTVRTLGFVHHRSQLWNLKLSSCFTQNTLFPLKRPHVWCLTLSMKYRFSLPGSNESHQQTVLSIFRASHWYVFKG